MTDFDVEKKLDDIMRLVGLRVEPAAAARSVGLLPSTRSCSGSRRNRRRSRTPRRRGCAAAVIREGSRRELRAFEEKMRTWTFGWEIYFKRSLGWRRELELGHAIDRRSGRFRPSLDRRRGKRSARGLVRRTRRELRGLREALLRRGEHLVERPPPERGRRGVGAPDRGGLGRLRPCSLARLPATETRISTTDAPDLGRPSPRTVPSRPGG